MLIQIGYLLLGALGLGFLIFIHEMGHYLMAKHVGMRVEAFSIGFGSPIYSWDRNGVSWRIGWIPFGGYVKIAGERKEGGKEIREIEGGFYSKKPVDRIKVAVIAPIVNLVFAFILFTAIWALGGREKPFHDLTNRIGWVDPKSELYQEGIRPGDEVTSYNNRETHGYKDIFQSTMMSKDSIRIKGYQYNYEAKIKKPFDVEVKTYQHPDFLNSDIQTAGVLSPANYLIYNTFNGKPNELAKGSPMVGSGLSYGDRLLWVDGQLLFSNLQLNSILNSQHTLLTIKRAGETKTIRVTRSKIGDLKVPSEYRLELGDLKYESGFKTSLSNLLIVPYQISPNLEIEVPIRYLDTDSAPSSNEAKLYPGDKIIAVDGKEVHSAKELFKHLQTHQFHVIAQTGNRNLPIIPWQKANENFDENINWSDLKKLESSIGTTQEVTQIGNLKLLKPITPMTLAQIAENSGNQDWILAMQEQRMKIEEISDPEKRQLAMQLYKQNASRLFLGVSFQDRQVNYNPPPYVLFGRTTADIYHTLKSLIVGNLKPKWLSGPIGIVQVMQHGWSLGVKEALYWLALISLNLGFLNLLPIPVLDGGQICFALYEQVTRKELKTKTMDRIVIPFMIIFIGLFVFVTFHDLSRLFKGIF